MLTNIIVGVIAFALGLYVDGVKQIYTNIVEWINEKPEEPYTIKAEDYYDGRRDS